MLSRGLKCDEKILQISTWCKWPRWIVFIKLDGTHSLKMLISSSSWKLHHFREELDNVLPKSCLRIRESLMELCGISLQIVVEHQSYKWIITGHTFLNWRGSYCTTSVCFFLQMLIWVCLTSNSQCNHIKICICLSFLRSVHHGGPHCANRVTQHKWVSTLARLQSKLKDQEKV